MSLFHNNSCGSQDTQSQCTGCACDVLRKLSPGSFVNIILKGGDDFLEGELTFACFDPKTCCATFILDGYPLIVDCEKIAAIQVLT
jgi:hypothetical protein